MNTFRRTALAIFEALGFGPDAENLSPKDEAYLDFLEVLNLACYDWFAGPGAAMGTMKLNLRGLNGASLTTGNLDLAEQYGYCGNEAAKHFVSYIDEKTGHAATLLMLEIVVAVQQIMFDERRPTVTAPGGDA